MSFLSKVTEFVGGSLFKEIKDAVVTYFPPDMSDKDKAEMELKLQAFLHDKAMEANGILNEAASQLDKRVREQEGTAKDLRAVPVIGNIILLLRGAQRPIWGYATLVLDYMWFFGEHTLTDKQDTAMIVINSLVLGFLFGERAVNNMAPIIARSFGPK